MTTPVIPEITVVPQRGASGEQFANDADKFARDLQSVIPAINALSSFYSNLVNQSVELSALTNAAKVEANAAREVAVGAANFRGEYRNDITYQTGQSVSFNGDRFIAKVVTLNVQPVDGPNWLKLLSGDVSLTASQTLTNKTISFNDNTLTGVASTTTAQTLSNKSLDNPTILNGFTEETSSANSGTAFTVSFANGSTQFITLTGNVTLTFPAPVAGKSFTLTLRQDATGSRTVGFPSTVRWPAGQAPVITLTAGRMDVVSFFSDGSFWYGSVAGQNYNPV